LNDLAPDSRRFGVFERRQLAKEFGRQDRPVLKYWLRMYGMWKYFEMGIEHDLTINQN
jgi:hypothetical protein